VDNEAVLLDAQLSTTQNKLKMKNGKQKEQTRMEISSKRFKKFVNK